MANLQQLLTNLKIPYKQLEWYQQALTHPSFTNEMNRQTSEHYQRLEFLGDAVLQMVISEYLFHHFTQLDEGHLSLFRSALVRLETLALLAKKLNFGPYLYLGFGEDKSGGRHKDSVLSDAFEAFVGALSLDAGLEFTKTFVLQLFSPLIAERPLSDWLDLKDPKTKLQELIQADQRKTIHYQKIRSEGPQDHQTFYVQVMLEEMILGQGSGTTIKAAEQEAARDALSKMATLK